MAKEKMEALVPVEEQPYPVPENWRWVRLGTAVSLSKDKTEDFSDDSVRYVGLENMEKDKGIISFGSSVGIKSLKNEFKKGQILYGKLRPYLNKHGVADFDGVCSTDILVFDALPISNVKYVDYFFDQPSFIQYAVNNSKGINLPRVSADIVMTAACPLPPIQEQKRIVDLVERMFAELDEAKEKAQAVVDGYEDRRGAILCKAFTGELIGIQCENVALNQICDSIRIGPFGSSLHKNDYITGGVPVINPKHIVNQTIKPENKVMIKQEKADELCAYKMKLGDIVMGRRGEMGRTAPVTEKEVGWLCGTGSLIIRLKEGFDSAFYSQVIASHSSVQYLEENCVGSTMNNLNERVVAGMPIPLMSYDQQIKTRKVASNLLASEKATKEVAEKTIEVINNIKKSILAKAFRGELETNDPNEEAVNIA